MAIVVYKCDVCKRVIELPQNKEGLDTIGRCVITNNCKGKLQFQKIKQAFISGKIPAITENLDDWIARKSLYTFDQNVAVKKWKVKHNLNANVSVQVYTITQSPSGDTLVENTDNVITILNSNELTIEFPFTMKGTVQCISRSTALDSLTDVIEPISQATKFRKISVNSAITIATPDSIVTNLILTGKITFLSSATAEVIDVTDITFIAHSVLAQPSSPWRLAKKVTIAGVTYTVWSVIVPFRNIPENSPFYLTLDAYPTNPGMFLISKEPHSQYDISTNEIIKMSNASSAATAVKWSFSSEKDFYISESTISKIYPEIFIA